LFRTELAICKSLSIVCVQNDSASYCYLRSQRTEQHVNIGEALPRECSGFFIGGNTEEPKAENGGGGSWGGAATIGAKTEKLKAL